jgi:peptidoglycan/xylan/chitin deacetylase (PgdA/CDA1 family)
MTPKIAYLTIDDAPTADFMQKIDFLEAQNVPAIFFCTGNRLEEHPEMIVSAIKRGFIIGNHTYDHPHCSDLLVEDICDQILKTDTLIDDLYDQAGVQRQHRFFRFPYGDKGGLQGDNVFAVYQPEGQKRKDQIQMFLRQLGYTQPAFDDVTYDYYRAANLLTDVDWYWTYDCMEWSVGSDNPLFGIDSLEAVFARMEEVVPEGGRGLNTSESSELVLMHDNLHTSSIFEPVVKRLLEKGLEFRLPV